MSLESEVIDIIEGKKSAPVTRSLLRGMSHGYRLLASLRNRAYDAELLSIVKTPTLVVSIGNITAGGTGKTPLVIHLAKELSKQEKVAILSRGYRSEVEASGQTVTIDHLSGLSASFYGDEPYLISQCVPEAIVIVGKNRIASAKRAQLLGAKLLLLDDGMQYRKLARDFEIVALDGRDPLGKGFYLPGGFLRDSPKRLENADLIVANFIQNREQAEEIQIAMRNYTSSPIVAMRTAITNSEEIAGKKVAAFCGIAKPERFFESIKNCNGVVVEKMTTLDHGVFLEKDLLEFSRKAKAEGAELLVCTEKDRVKLSKGLQLELPLVSLKTDLENVSGREHWESLIEKIYQKLKEVKAS